MASQSSIVFAPRPAQAGADEVAHGYPPPERPAGSTVVAYCGEVITVRGESSEAPPPDTCPECATIWERRRHRLP